MSELTPKPSAPLNPDAAIGGSGDGDEARWVKAPDPAWTFRRKGLLPLTALVSLVLYGVTAFATRTERRVLDEVRLALHGEGLTWVQAHAAGQRVVLRGSPPNDEAAKAAKDVVASTRCDTWLGALPCVSSVDVRFEASAAPASDVPVTDVPSDVPASDVPASDTPASDLPATDVPASETPLAEESVAAAAATADPATTGSIMPAEESEEARWYALRAVRSGQALRLTGEVPSAAMSLTLVETARAALPNTVAVKNALTLTEGTASSGWEAAAKRLIEVMAQCSSGRADISSRKLEVNCEVLDKGAQRSLQALSQQPIPGFEVGALNVLVLEDITACEEALGKLLRRSQIRFATGSAKLLPSSRPLLKEIASQLQDCPGVVVVEGHTDGQGDREQNVQLSKERALVVVAALGGAGVPAERVRAEGFGPDRPLATNETATGRAQNRRIEFRVARSATSGE